MEIGIIDNKDETDVAARFNSFKYRLIERIGQGGFGRVYKAVQVNTQQEVAIKILTIGPDFDEAKRKRYIERFERETLLGSYLQHPNLVRLLDKGRCDDDLIYAVFEYVDGQSLRERLLESGAISPLETAEIMSQVLDALVHAHKQGVVHRDIKPANIMLSKVGAKTHAKVLDFGIGALVNEARQLEYKTLTLTQESLGTPSYSAPEQLRGEPPTPKTDLYVWGLVFVECLTGRPAISGSSLASVFHKQLDPSNVPLPSSTLGHPVAALLRRVLNKKTSERATDAADVYKELAQINFSTLVGDLTSSKNEFSLSSNSAVTLNSIEDVTRINSDTSYYTGLEERKQISVLCLTLCIRSVTQEAVDLEVIDAIHRDQKSQCVDIAIEYGAFHAGSLGDTLLFYFGYPNVTGNDSRLCARTALDIISRLYRSNSLRQHSQGLIAEAHIGIHTGMVTNYVDAMPEGDTPNIAMKLSRLALPNQILCSEVSRKLLDGYLEFEPIETRTNSDLPKETSLFLLTGEREAEAIGFLRANRQYRDFIGREKELASLVELLSANESFDGGVGKSKFAYVYGEAGIGKSRLVFELRSMAKNIVQYGAQCLPEYKNTALYPILNILKYKYSLDVKSPSEAVEELRTILGKQRVKDENLSIPLLCAWLNLPIPEDFEPVFLAPDIQKQLLFDALSILLLFQNSSAVFHQNIYFLEDIHWADQTSIEFIRRFVIDPDFKEKQHVFISTSRQALPDSLSDVVSQVIEVKKLDDEKTADFISHLFDGQNVADNVLEVIGKKTDGIPLFVEELIAMLKQKHLVHRLNGIINFTSDDKLDEIPNSLRDSLQQNLDSLIGAKETAQIASAIGREFDYTLLLQSSCQSEELLQGHINELTAAELIYTQRKVGGDSYIFKHALVRDAAYESMTEAGRKNAHLNIATTIESNFPLIVEQSPSELSRHFASAGEYGRAIVYETLSAKNCLDLSASKACIAHCNNLYDWSNKLEDDERDKEHLNASILMTLALMNKDGWAGEEVSRYASKCFKLASKVYFDTGEVDISVTDSSNQSLIVQLVQIYYALIVHNIVAGNRGEIKSLENKQLVDLVRDLEKIMELTEDQSLLSAALTILGYFYYTKGDFDIAANKLEASISNYRPEFDHNHGVTYGLDSFVWSAATLGLLYWLKDENERATAYMQMAVDAGRTLGHMPSLGIALMYKCILHQYQQDPISVRQTSEELIEKATKYDLPAYLAYGAVINHWALNETECLAEQQRREKLLEAEGTIMTLKNLGCFHAVPYFESLIADIEISLNLKEDANRRLSNCIDLCLSIGEHYFHPMLPYRKSFVEEELGRTLDAELSLVNAMDWAEKTSMNKVSILAKERLASIKEVMELL